METDKLLSKQAGKLPYLEHPVLRIRKRDLRSGARRNKVRDVPQSILESTSRLAKRDPAWRTERGMRPLATSAVATEKGVDPVEAPHHIGRQMNCVARHLRVSVDVIAHCFDVRH